MSETPEELELVPPVPFPLDKDFLPELTQTATDWALLHGIGMRSRSNYSLESITITPFLLLPTPFPANEFQKVVDIQKNFNILMHKIAYDDEFLRKTLSSTIEADDFTARLFKIYDMVQQRGFAPQKISLGLLRSDYLLDSPSPYLAKQVEVNTISCSFAPLTSVLPQWHRQALSLLGRHDLVEKVPLSNSLNGYVNGLLTAWKIYNSENAAILFVVEDITYNVCDQRMLEFEIIKQNPKIRVLRRSLTQIRKNGVLKNGEILIIDENEIAVIYFRSAYDPSFYHSEVEWDARILMEQSRAIKCPSIQYQLAGTKKVQQELALPGVLERFFPKGSEADSMREVFTGLFSIDMNDPTADKTIEMAITNPSKYVLKPQREGGGNNIYDEEVKTYLEKIRDSPERNAWILMEKINPPLQKNYMVRPGLLEPIFTDTVSELGIYGVIIGDATTVTLNEQVGHMLRTKVSSANEGGVSGGSGALDSVFLV